MADAAPKFTVKPVTPATWPDFEALFESKGAPKYCWCMAWRPMENRVEAVNADRRKAIQDRVEKRTPVGLIGYLGGGPVAWCSVAPRDSLLKMSPDQNDAEVGVWSVVCFFIRSEHRGAGLSRRMLDEAAKYAKKDGAKVLEGYPVDRDSPSYRFMGFTPLFENKGFKSAGRAGTRRHVMRLEL